MLRISFVGLLVFLSASLFSQIKVSGTITDAKTGEMLVGATISSKDAKSGTVTDNLGNFSFELPKIPDQQIIVQYVGYEQKIFNVQESMDTNIILIPGKYLEEVVIKSVRAPQEAPIVQSNLSRREIRKVYRGEHPIYFLSALTPAITTESESGTSFGNYGTMRLRGLEQKRINFTLNGIPLNDMIDHGVYFSNFTDIANSFESVQVQRGVGTSSNGVASYAGSVNFESINLEKQETGAEIQLGYGSYNSSRVNGQFNTGLLKNRWAFHGSYSRLFSDGYKDNTESNAYSFFFSGGYFGKKDVVKINAFDTRSRNGLGYEAVDEATIKEDPTYNALDENDDDDFGQQFVQLQHIHNFNSGLQLVSSLYFNGAGGDFFWGGRDTTGFLEQYNYPLSNRHYGIMTNVQYNPFDNLQVSGGVHYYTFRRNNLEQLSPDFSNPYYDEHAQKDEISAFVKAGYTFGELKIFGDVDMRHTVLVIMPDFSFLGIEPDANPEKSWTFINPKVGLSYVLSRRTTFFASVGKTSREPTKVDILGGYGLYDSASYAALKDGIDFRHEQVIDAEAGIRHYSQGFSAEANVFYMQFKNGILPTGETIEFGSQVRTNIPESYRTGVELMVNYIPFNKLSLGMNASYIFSRIDELTFSGDTIAFKDITPPFSPEWIINGFVTYELTDAVEITLNGRYVSESYMTLRNEPEYIFPSYFLLNGQVRIKFLRNHQFSLEVNNITSTDYYTNGKPVDTDGDWLPDSPGYMVNAPINFFGTFTFRF